ncbi:MAG TPA: cytochrome c3 family protein [Candidatus Angelobacter sp.]|nr:cytochrome c3 family protein [Candidatus Angelobacter sp.]
MAQIQLRWMALVFAGVALLAAPQNKTPAVADPSQYVGTETCMSCHEEIGAGFAQNPHGKAARTKARPQWRGCEECHGAGRSHAEAGDPERIVRPQALTRGEASRLCLQCHGHDRAKEPGALVHAQHPNIQAGCLDCHSQHFSSAPHLLRMAEPKLCATCHAGGKPTATK